MVWGSQGSLGSRVSWGHRWIFLLKQEESFLLYFFFLCAVIFKSWCFVQNYCSGIFMRNTVMRCAKIRHGSNDLYAWIIFAAKAKKFNVSTFSLCTLLGDHLSHLVHLPVVLLVHLNDMTIITYPIAQQPILSPTWSQLQHSLQLLHQLADPLDDDLQLQFALLASSVSIELVSSSARVTSEQSQPRHRDP